ncbi:MAG: hypothetical protein CMF56_09510 [Leifsonia sp.]|nr:hypothetical protein [Leifsonia sp.]
MRRPDGEVTAATPGKLSSVKFAASAMQRRDQLCGGATMVHVPVLRALNIDGYGLFPGFDGHTVHLDQHLTVVLGANGIGKSTLVLTIFRLLTGPADIPAFLGTEPLGTASLAVHDLPRHHRKSLAHRVLDARQASAKLTFDVGASTFSVARSIDDLSLVEASCDGTTIEGELALREALAQATEVGSFSDFILLLRYISFYREDRRSLLWDQNAQRQVLRPLFLSPHDANEWVRRERDILKLDSERRNLSAAANRVDKRLSNDQARTSTVAEVAVALQVARQRHDELTGEAEAASIELAELDRRKREAQLAVMQAEEQLQQRRTALQSDQSRSIAQLLPGADATLRYLLARLGSDDSCTLCGGGGRVASGNRSSAGRAKRLWSVREFDTTRQRRIIAAAHRPHRTRSRSRPQPSAGRRSPRRRQKPGGRVCGPGLHHCGCATPTRRH